MHYCPLAGLSRTDPYANILRSHGLSRQGDIQQQKFTSMTKTAATLYGESGILAFFRGWHFRTGRMVLAMGIMDECRRGLAPLLFGHHFQ